MGTNEAVKADGASGQGCQVPRRFNPVYMTVVPEATGTVNDMDYHTWKPVYGAIRADFGYDQARDERARDVLGDLVAGRVTADPRRIDADGATVAVAGGAPCLDSDLDMVREAEVVVAASTATDRLAEAGLAVDCMVTDLDKNPETVTRLAAEGTTVVVHAHGDNVPSLREFVPVGHSEAVLPTTQTAPKPPVRNFGGFTDGDRAAFLADALGAASLTFPGWDFDDPGVSEEKRRKLVWAERLLHWLERRREERFDLLEDRRNDIETETLPI